MCVRVEDPVAVACHRSLPSNARLNLSAPVARRKVALLESLLLSAAFAIVRHLGHSVGSISAVLDKGIPRLHPAGLERGHEVPQGRPGDVMGKAGIPGDRDAERQMLVEIEIAAELSFHKR